MPNNEIRTLFVDNCAGHNTFDPVQAVLHEINTSLRRLSPNTTHLTQLPDQSPIREIKGVWGKIWDSERNRRIMERSFSTESGKLNHPTRHCYMALALQCVYTVNAMVYQNGLSVPRKALITCGLANDVDGIWRREQLHEQLR